MWTRPKCQDQDQDHSPRDQDPDQELRTTIKCSEISCNVKWNVYLAMKIPDCVSFVSG